jgi:hypothetical protein
MGLKSCSLCVAFSALTEECRRHAPVTFPVAKLDAHTLQPIPGSYSIFGIYPETKPTGWCAEFVAEDGTATQQ